MCLPAPWREELLEPGFQEGWLCTLPAVLSSRREAHLGKDPFLSLSSRGPDPQSLLWDGLSQCPSPDGTAPMFLLMGVGGRCNPPREGLGVQMEGADIAEPLGLLGRHEGDSLAAETMDSCRIRALCLSRLPACLSISFLMQRTGETVSFFLGKVVGC